MGPVLSPAAAVGYPAVCTLSWGPYSCRGPLCVSFYGDPADNLQSDLYLSGTGADQRQVKLEENTRAYIEDLAEQVEPYCETLSWNTLRDQDLTETEDGILFHAEFGEEYCPSPCSIHFEFDEYCRVQELKIQVGIDPAFTRQEILDHTQKHLDHLFPLFEKENFATRDVYFEEMGVLPRGFRETFLNAHYYPMVNYHELDKHPMIDFKYVEDENGNVAEGSYIELTLYLFG